MASIGENIKRFRQQMRWTQARLAQEADVPQSRISELETGRQAHSKDLPKIAKALKRRVGEIDESQVDEGHYTPPPAVLDREDTMPLHGSAEGGKGHIIVTTGEIGRVARPDILQGVEKAYAILVTGTSMKDAYEPNDRALVNPRLMPKRETDCILYSVDEDLGEAKATIKRLVTWNDEEWTLRQHFPKKVFKLSRKIWNVHHRVVGNLKGQ